MKRIVIPAATAALTLCLTAPAWAHEEITPDSVPTGTPVFFALSAANEKKVDLTKVTVSAPAGAELGVATKDPAGWTSTASNPSAVWTGGAVKPGRFEQFGFEIEGADQPGTLTFKVALGYSDGTTDQVDVPVKATAASASGTAAASDTNDGQATAALVFSLLALLVAVGAVVVAVRIRSRSEKPTPTDASGGQDW